MRYYLSSVQRSFAIAILLWAALYTDRVSKIILYHICRLVLKRNKMHEREVALWNARMRIYFDARNDWEIIDYSFNSFRLMDARLL